MQWLIVFGIVILAAISGAGAGVWLAPEKPRGGESVSAGSVQSLKNEKSLSYYKIDNQFITPLFENGRVSALILMSVTLQMQSEDLDAARFQEPRLRDAFMRVMFDHANAGGFSGTFTSEAQLSPLRQALLETARKVLALDVSEVLIGDLLRQEQ